MISPLLANVYLHYVFDLWAQRWRRREATGDMIVVRYADDIIVGFEHQADAQRFRDAMRARLQGGKRFCLGDTVSVWAAGGRRRSGPARSEGC